MAKGAEKLEAIRMRRQGLSLSDISQTLKVSKSSISAWCRDIPLSTAQKEQLREKSRVAGNSGRLKGAQVNKEKKLHTLEMERNLGKEVFSMLSSRELLICGTALYWGEGSKTDHLSLTNSDPGMLLFFKEWIEGCFGVPVTDLMPRIYINELHRDREAVVLNYWSRTLKIPKKQFRNTTFIRSVSKKKYENHDSHYGLVSLRVRKGTYTRYKILGLIHALKNSKLPEAAGVAQLVRAQHS